MHNSLHASGYMWTHLIQPNYSKASQSHVCYVLSCVQLFAALWTIACQVALSMEFSRQEYWSVWCHFLLQGIFPTQGLKQGLPHCRQTLYHLSHQGCPYWYANAIFCGFWGEVWTALLFLWGFSRVNWVLPWERLQFVRVTNFSPWTMAHQMGRHPKSGKK